MSNPRLVEVSFEGMLKSDCLIVCEHWTLFNSINEFGIDFTQPMLFREFLQEIGKHLTSMNCKSLFHQAKWYVWTSDSDEIIEKYYMR